MNKINPSQHTMKITYYTNEKVVIHVVPIPPIPGV